MKLKVIIAVIVLSSISLIVKSQTNVQSILEKYMDHIRTEEYAKTPDKEIYSEENAPELLNLVQSYYNDSLPKIRLKAYYLTYKAANKSSKEIRESSVLILVNALKDKDSGNVGSIASWLTEFISEDFNTEAKVSLVNVLKTQVFYLDEIIKLVAFVGISEQNGYLKNNLRNGTYQSGKVKWAAHLALARLGVEEEIDFCLNMVKKQGVNDDVIYELVPDLIYTRQKKSFDYVVELLQSKAKNCMSGNPENSGKIMCGYRIMEFLAPIIKDFPLTKDSDGDLMIDDYEQALIELREWFATYQNDYEIITDTF